jgi:predicted DNA-binding helix-hairpin-helix protein
MILRVPGIGPLSARKIVMARRYRRLNYQHLKKIGVVLKRAKYFISCNELQAPTINEIKPEMLQKLMLSAERSSGRKKPDIFQLSLFDDQGSPKPIMQLKP